MKRTGTVCLLLLLGTLAARAADPAELLRRVDRLVSFTGSDFSAEYLVAQSRAGEGVDATRVAIFRRDAEQKYLILVLSPLVDRGKGYLKIGEKIWFYDPGSRAFTFTSSADRFRNSNARNSDFTASSFAIDYAVTAVGSEQLGKFACTVFSLKAVNDRVTFPITRLWISEDALLRKSEDFGLSGQLLRTVLIPTYQAVGSRFVPSSIVIVDQLKGKMVDGAFVGDRTQITITKPSLAALPDNLFTKAYLEKVGQ